MKNNLGLEVHIGHRYIFEYLYENHDYIVFIGEVVSFESPLTPTVSVGVKILQEKFGRVKDYFKVSSDYVIYGQDLLIRDSFGQYCYTYLEGQDKP